MAAAKWAPHTSESATTAIAAAALWAPAQSVAAVSFLWVTVLVPPLLMSTLGWRSAHPLLVTVL